MSAKNKKQSSERCQSVHSGKPRIQRDIYAFKFGQYTNLSPPSQKNRRLYSCASTHVNRPVQFTFFHKFSISTFVFAGDGIVLQKHVSVMLESHARSVAPSFQAPKPVHWAGARMQIISHILRASRPSCTSLLFNRDENLRASSTELGAPYKAVSVRPALI